MRTPQVALKLVAVRPSGLLPPTGFQTLGGRDMNAIQAKSDKLIDTALRNTRGMRWSGDVAVWHKCELPRCALFRIAGMPE
jgi:hypothetical protein